MCARSFSIDQRTLPLYNSFLVQHLFRQHVGFGDDTLLFGFTPVGGVLNQSS